MTPEWIAIILTGAAVAMQFLGMVLGGIWIVSRMQSSIAVLDNSLKSLGDSVNKLAASANKMEDRQRETEQNVAVLKATRDE